MFSFIKMLESIHSYIMSKKWLFFTMLTITSATGILVSMTAINFMTRDVAKQTYMEEHRLDKKLLEGFLVAKYDSLLSVAGLISIHPTMISHLNDKSDEKLNNFLQSAATTINDRTNSVPINIKYYAKDHKIVNSENIELSNLVMDSKQNVSGIVINKDGVRLIGITPIEHNKKVIGAIEVSQSVHAVKDDFERLGKEFVFILNKSQLVFLDVSHKTDVYHDIDDNYKVAFHEYDSKFYVNLQKLDIEELINEKYVNTKNFYTTNDPAIDLNGREIGLFVIGESANNANSFVQITKNMITSVTTVALGLVISLILFMF